jgi:hypothetical protein
MGFVVTSFAFVSEQQQQAQLQWKLHFGASHVLFESRVLTCTQQVWMMTSCFLVTVSEQLVDLHWRCLYAISNAEASGSPPFVWGWGL